MISAHPRSRGENRIEAAAQPISAGSSPLTRGKRSACASASVLQRLIPAHAGKTSSPGVWSRPARAHPRSRGENSSASRGACIKCGSSPLTRGKPCAAGRARPRGRLIPAHAGKTHLSAREIYRDVAHPRSRGENEMLVSISVSFRGSSPLTRGKPPISDAKLWGDRLIPAHAGKTESRGAEVNVSQAHPRSRGENFDPSACGRLFRGSSPLTRGKLAPRATPVSRGRLIPAHAGKTSDHTDPGPAFPAHPRSRGENTSRPALLLRRSIRSWKPLSLPSPLEVTQFGSLAQLTRRRIRFGVLASSFRVVGAHHECESIEVNGLPGIAPRQEGESLLVARTKDHDSPTRFHVLSDDVPQALAYTGAERPHEDPRGNLHEPPRHVTSQPLGHRGQDQDDHQESLSS